MQQPMVENKKARPAGSTAERAETGTALAGKIPYNDFTISVTRKQGLIESLLLQGEANAIPSSDLVSMTGVKSVRELQLIISQEREAGALILSTCRGGGGYFLPSDGEVGKREIAAFVATLRARALNTLRALKTAREALESLEGQVALNDLEGV